MASRYVPCRDKDEMIRMYHAGLLCINIALDHAPEGWRSQKAFSVGLHVIEGWYGHAEWLREDFAYLVEED